MHGTVARFSNERGYGFITSKEDGKDYFCHQTAIKMDGYRTLAPGEHVEFDIDYRIEDNKPLAVHVRKLEDSHGTASNPGR